MAKVRIHSKLMAAAHEDGLLAAAHVYVLARACDAGGAFAGVAATTGRIPLSVFARTIAELTGRTPGNVRRRVREGDGYFWHVADGHVYLHNVHRVAQCLGLDNAGERFREHELEEVLTSKRFKAAAMNSRLPATLRRETRRRVAERTGVPATTQRRWERDGTAFHTDGRDRTPLASPATYNDHTAMVPAGRNPKETIAQWVIEQKSSEGYGGFFTPGSGRVHQQAPKPFMPGGELVRRRVPKRFRQPDTVSVYAGNGSSRRTKNKSFVYVPTGERRLTKHGTVWERVKRHKDGVIVRGDIYDHVRKVVPVIEALGMATEDNPAPDVLSVRLTSPERA